MDGVSINLNQYKKKTVSIHFFTIFGVFFLNFFEEKLCQDEVFYLCKDIIDINQTTSQKPVKQVEKINYYFIKERKQRELCIRRLIEIFGSYKSDSVSMTKSF